MIPDLKIFIVTAVFKIAKGLFLPKETCLNIRVRWQVTVTSESEKGNKCDHILIFGQE